VLNEIPKGCMNRFLNGEIDNLTGVSTLYEEPEDQVLVVDT